MQQFYKIAALKNKFGVDNAMFRLNDNRMHSHAEAQTNDGASKGTRRFFQSTLAIGLIAGLIGACAESTTQTPAPEGSANVQTEDVAENTEGYIGQIVTIRSEPLEKVGDNSFTVSDQRLFSNEPILVINATGEPLLLPEDSVDV